LVERLLDHEFEQRLTDDDIEEREDEAERERHRTPLPKARVRLQRNSVLELGLKDLVRLGKEGPTRNEYGGDIEHEKKSGHAEADENRERRRIFRVEHVHDRHEHVSEKRLN